MKVLLISSWYPPIQSGSSFYAESLAKALHRQGHEVTVVTTSWQQKSVSKEERDGIWIYCLPAWVLPPLPFLLNLKIIPISLSVNNFRWLRDFVARYKPDIIHQVNHIFDSALLSAKIAKNAHIPLVCTISTPLQHPNPFLHAVMSFIDRLIVGNLIAKHWAGVICMDSEVERYVKETYSTSVSKHSEIIAYGVRDDFYNQTNSHDFTMKANNPQIVLVGHIHPLRNPTNIIRAMPLILEQIPDVRMIIAGRVQFRKPVEEAKRLGVLDAVQFLGEVNHKDIMHLVQSSHIMATYGSGRYTGLGTACVEGMLCNIPLVIDLPEDLFGKGKLRNWENIVLVNRDNVSEIAGAIIKLLKDASLRSKIGIGGNRFVHENLHWDVIAKEISSFYSTLIPDVN